MAKTDKNTNTKKVTSTALKCSGGSGRKMKVWKITNFRELFELPDDVRKKRPGPLTFTKSVVTIGGTSKPEEVRHYEKIKDLKSRPNRHLLRSIFEDLKNWSGGKYYGQRGYLITTTCKPASYMYLAAQLGVDIKELQKAMGELEKIGLLERVVMNGQFDDSGKSRIHPDESGRKRPPLKKDKSKSNRKGKVNKNKLEIEKGTITKVNAIEINSERDQQRKASTTPATTPSNNPTKTDETRQDDTQGCDPNAGTPDKHSGHIANTIEFMKYKYDQQSMEFAYEIMLKLGHLTQTDMRRLKDGTLHLDEKQAAERGCWAKAWYEASKVFSSETMTRLRVQIFKRISPAKKCGENPSAYLRTAWNNLLEDMRRKNKSKAVVG